MTAKRTSTRCGCHARRSGRRAAACRGPRRRPGTPRGSLTWPAIRAVLSAPGTALPRYQKACCQTGSAAGPIGASITLFGVMPDPQHRRDDVERRQLQLQRHRHRARPAGRALASVSAAGTGQVAVGDDRSDQGGRGLLPLRGPPQPARQRPPRPTGVVRPAPGPGQTAASYRRHGSVLRRRAVRRGAGSAPVRGERTTPGTPGLPRGPGSECRQSGRCRRSRCRSPVEHAGPAAFRCGAGAVPPPGVPVPVVAGAGRCRPAAGRGVAVAACRCRGAAAGSDRGRSPNRAWSPCGGRRSQVGVVKVSLSNVTAPLRASARPWTVTPLVTVIDGQRQDVPGEDRARAQRGGAADLPEDVALLGAVDQRTCCPTR